MIVSEASMRTCVFTLHVESSSSPEFIDITERVAELVADSNVRSGWALVFSKHTTAAITIQENEPLLLTDMANFLERLSPKTGHYRHNDFSVRTVHMHEDECPNGHSHCQHLSLGSSETIPVIEGELALGQWQRIFMVELDGEKATQVGRRELIVQVMGM
jgi:secondary thiamine-phosphate synthase enzyme